MVIPQLTFTRFLAAISVVMLHFGLLTWPVSEPWLSSIFGKADSAVSYFFVLSGFILVISSVRNTILPEKVDSVSFWKKRAIRILPVYLFSVFVYFLLEFHYNPEGSLWGQVQPYAYSVFLLQSWKHKLAMDVNFPAWSLSVEALFYIAFPWIYRLLYRLKDKVLILVSVIAWVTGTVVYGLLMEKGFPESFIKFFPPMHLGTFVIGVCSGIVFVRNYAILRNPFKIGLFSVTIALFCTLVLAAHYWDWLFVLRHNGLLSPFFVMVFYSLALMEGPLVRLFASKPFVLLGEVSYSIYLFQFPVMLICLRYIPWLAGKEQKTIFWWYILILLIVSTIVYFLLEKPAKKMLSKYFLHKSVPVDQK